MGRRAGRKITRRLKAEGVKAREEQRPDLIACGRISGGVSVTYVPLRAMPDADEISTVAIRRVTRAIGAESRE